MNDHALYFYAAELVRIVDADTQLFRLDLGFDIHLNIRGRLKGIDAPEIKTPEGKEAKAFVESWFQAAKILTVKSHGADKYARWDVTIWGNQSGESLNDALIRAGHAMAVKW